MHPDNYHISLVYWSITGWEQQEELLLNYASSSTETTALYFEEHFLFTCFRDWE